MKQKDIEFLNNFCRAISKHKVSSEDGMVSVAFSGNCGIFAMCLVLFLEDTGFPFDDWKIGFMFDKIDSLDEVYDSDCEADLNHVFLVLDGKYFDGNGEADPSEWYGKLFLKDDSIDGIVEIIQNFTDISVTDSKLNKIMNAEWNKLNGDEIYPIL